MSSREDANHFFTQDSYQDSVSGLRVFIQIKKVLDVTLYFILGDLDLNLFGTFNFYNVLFFKNVCAVSVYLLIY